MENNNLRIIWEERGGSKSRLYGGINTTFSNVRQFFKDSGKHPNDFNALIIGAKVFSGSSVNCVLWCSGFEVGNLFNGLRDRGLCSEVCKAVAD